jgi:HPt (histidine-containing phosphotransfer) domain-containing protein
MSVESVSAGAVLDVEGALLRFGGDTQLFAEMAGFVLEDGPSLYSQLQQAVLNQDVSAIRMKAHALKGLVASCGGVRAASAAQKMETAGTDADTSRTDSLVAELGDELERLNKALRGYLS